MKHLSILVMAAILLIITACHKDNLMDNPTSTPQEEQFSLDGKWFNPDMNCWYSEGDLWHLYAWEQDDFYKTIEFTDECQTEEQWHGNGIERMSSTVSIPSRES